MMRLNDLRDLPGATTSKKRVGRGLGSGLGKTSGHGQKGQKSRSGVAIKGFEGGQMPLHRRLPKRGFNNIFAKDYNEVNVGRIQAAIDDKKLDASKPVTVEALVEAGVIRRARDGVRLLGKGELKAKVSFELTGASSGAVKIVEAAGGTVTLTPMPQRTAKPEGEGAPKKAAKSTSKTPPAKKSGPKKVVAKKSAAKKDTSE
jgi:large subunit ribosomal protein L15